MRPTGGRGGWSTIGGCRTRPTTFLSERRDERQSRRLLRARRGSCGPLSRRRRGRASRSARRVAAASPACIANLAAWASGFGGLRLRALASLRRRARDRLPARACLASTCACAAGPRRRATRPSPSRRGRADNPRPLRALPIGPFASMPNTGLPLASVSPTLPKRRLPGVRTRERTSFRPRLRALSASASRRSSLTVCPSREGSGRPGRRRGCR